MNTALALMLFSIAAIWGLWVFFLAVMSLQRARDAGLLTPFAKVLGYPVLFAGLALDAIVNTVVMTILFLELPREWTVTSRLKRHNREGRGTRQKLAQWFEPLLDPYDPNGDHI